MVRRSAIGEKHPGSTANDEDKRVRQSPNSRPRVACNSVLEGKPGGLEVVGCRKRKGERIIGQQPFGSYGAAAIEQTVKGVQLNGKVVGVYRVTAQFHGVKQRPQ